MKKWKARDELLTMRSGSLMFLNLLSYVWLAIHVLVVYVSTCTALCLSWSQICVSMATFTTKLIIPSSSLQLLQERGHSQEYIEDVFYHCLILKMKSSYNDSITGGIGGCNIHVVVAISVTAFEAFVFIAIDVSDWSVLIILTRSVNFFSPLHYGML